MMNKYMCPCCRNYTLLEERVYEICSICGWEDDPIQFNDPNFYGGANHLSLNAYKKNYSELSEKIISNKE